MATVYKFDQECKQVSTHGVDNGITILVDTSASMKDEKTQNSVTRILNSIIDEEGIEGEKEKTFRNDMKCLAPNGNATHLIASCEHVFKENKGKRIIVLTDGLDNDPSYNSMTISEKAKKIEEDCPGLEMVWILFAKDERENKKLKPFRDALVSRRGTYAVMLTDELTPRQSKMLIRASKKKTNQDRNVKSCLLYDEDGFGKEVEESVKDIDCEHLDKKKFDFSMSSEGVSETLREKDFLESLTPNEFVEQLSFLVEDRVSRQGVLSTFQTIPSYKEKIAFIIAFAIYENAEKDIFEPCSFWGRRKPLIKSAKLGGVALKSLLNGMMGTLTSKKPKNNKIRMFSGKHVEEQGVKRVRYDINASVHKVCVSVAKKLEDKHKSIVELMKNSKTKKRKFSGDEYETQRKKR